MIAERPNIGRPDPKARWIPGYWDWDQAENDYVWISGTWQVPPGGSMWVTGRWMRDSEGWYRVPGAWSLRRDSGLKIASTNSKAVPEWRRNGPPADHPDDSPGVAPGPDYFYLAGHYAPDGEHVTWKPGFWARVQPGWDWSPARWVRRPEGWEFRRGSWVRETSALAQTADPNERSTARPLPGDTTSSTVDPQSYPSAPAANPDESPPIAGGAIEGGAIAGSEAPGPAPLPGPQTVVPPGTVIIGEGEPMVFGRVTGMPYVVVRPPGYFPYGPTGVVVPTVVPRFVRRFLDRILP